MMNSKENHQKELKPAPRSRTSAVYSPRKESPEIINTMERVKKQFVPDLLLAIFFFPFDIPVVFCPFPVCGLHKK